MTAKYFKAKESRKSFTGLMLLFITGITLGFLAGAVLFPLAKSGGKTPALASEEELQALQGINETIGTTVTTKIPAVDSDGNGVVSELIVTSREGTGLILVGVNNVLADYYTQYSAREAVLAAQNYLKDDFGNKDIIFQISSGSQDISLVGGPSAGAAMAVATIAALENKSLNEDIMITGTINEEGMVGPVGGVLAKAMAAKEAGIQTFLVPPSESRSYTYREEQSCRIIRGGEYCRITYKPVYVNISRQAEIEVQEVSNIDEALKWFIA